MVLNFKLDGLRKDYERKEDEKQYFPVYAVLIKIVMMPYFNFCLDINECMTMIPSPCRCGVSGEPCGASCTNLVPGYACSCAEGFKLGSGGTICNGITFLVLSWYFWNAAK